MPRKQRFKPSRKPKTDANVEATVSNPHVGDRREFQESTGVERQAPVDEAPRDIETDKA
jgi:hypothetical protein